MDLLIVILSIVVSTAIAFLWINKWSDFVFYVTNKSKFGRWLIGKTVFGAILVLGPIIVFIAYFTTFLCGLFGVG